MSSQNSKLKELKMGTSERGNGERIRQYVLDCNIRRLTAEETAEYLRQNGLPVNVRRVTRYRAKIRESAQPWIARLGKSKRSDYIAEYRGRIEEVRAHQRKLWNICNDKDTLERIRVEAIRKLIDCTSRLVDLYDALPQINLGPASRCHLWTMTRTN